MSGPLTLKCRKCQQWKKPYLAVTENGVQRRRERHDESHRLKIQGQVKCPSCGHVFWSSHHDAIVNERKEPA